MSAAGRILLTFLLAVLLGFLIARHPDAKPVILVVGTLAAYFAVSATVARRSGRGEEF